MIGRVGNHVQKSVPTGKIHVHKLNTPVSLVKKKKKKKKEKTLFHTEPVSLAKPELELSYSCSLIYLNPN